jgi:uncharacterized protein HemY
MGDWGRARADLEQALTVLPEESRIAHGSWMVVALGRLSLAEGRWDQAFRQLEEALALAEHSKTWPVMGGVLGILAEYDLLTGRPAAARTRLEARRHFVRTDTAAESLSKLLWAYVETGEEAQAARLLEQRILHVRAQQNQVDLVDLLQVQGRLALRQQQWEQAAAALEEALLLCRAMPYPYAEAKTLYVYGLVHGAKGEPDQARAQWEAALAICARLGERLYAEQIEQALAGLER